MKLRYFFWTTIFLLATLVVHADIITLTLTIQGQLEKTSRSITIPQGSQISILGELGWAYRIRYKDQIYLTSKAVLNKAMASEAAAVLFTPIRPEAEIQACTVTFPPIDEPLKIIPRATWDPVGRSSTGQMAPFLRAGQKAKMVVLHHTAGNGGPFSIKRDHAKKYLDIGYHFIIPKAADPKGEVFEGRSLQFQGSHVHQQNSLKIGVVLIGNFHPHDIALNPEGNPALPDGDSPTPYQVTTLRKLMKHLRGLHPSLGKMLGHSDLASTLCPGANAIYLTREGM